MKTSYQQFKINYYDYKLLLFILLMINIFLLRPWHLKLGANTRGVELSLPGDEIAKKPDFNATHGFSISAPSEEIWKWIIQIGSMRAVWYSIDWMDNGGVPGTFDILPEFQNIEIGKFIPVTPDQKYGMWVNSSF